MLRRKMNDSVEKFGSAINSFSFSCETNTVFHSGILLLNRLQQSDKPDDILLAEYNATIVSIVILSKVAQVEANITFSTDSNVKLPGLDVIYKILDEYSVNPMNLIPACSEQAALDQCHQCVIKLEKALSDNHLIDAYIPILFSKFILAGISITQLTLSPTLYNVEQSMRQAVSYGLSFFEPQKADETVVVREKETLGKTR